MGIRPAHGEGHPGAARSDLDYERHCNQAGTRVPVRARGNREGTTEQAGGARYEGTLIPWPFANQFMTALVLLPQLLSSSRTASPNPLAEVARNVPQEAATLVRTLVQVILIHACLVRVPNSLSGSAVLCAPRSGTPSPAPKPKRTVFLDSSDEEAVFEGTAAGQPVPATTELDPPLDHGTV